MLENDRPADEETVKHIDRCLTCLSCMTTCPSGVHYMHLVDHARHRIEQTYVRPLHDRLTRRLLGIVLPRPDLFRLALILSRLAKPFGFLLPRKLKAALALAPRKLPARSALDGPNVFPAEGARRRRVALMDGCAQKTLSPQINEATIRLLTRHGCDVVVARGRGLLRRADPSSRPGRRPPSRGPISWPGPGRSSGGGLDAIIINASGCGTTVKDYGFMFRNDPALAEKARAVSALTRDITEFMSEIGLQPTQFKPGRRVAYHSACSLQHGQKVREEPKKLLAGAGFTVLEPAGGPFVLRLGGNLQHHAAGNRPAAARPQGRQNRKPRPGNDRGRQYRLHHADRHGNEASRGPYGRIARLGDRRTETRRFELTVRLSSRAVN